MKTIKPATEFTPDDRSEDLYRQVELFHRCVLVVGLLVACLLAALAIFHLFPRKKEGSLEISSHASDPRQRLWALWAVKNNAVTRIMM